MVLQLDEPVLNLVDRGFQAERIQATPAAPEFDLHGARHRGVVQQSPEGALGPIVEAFDAAPLPSLAHQAGGGEETVDQQPQVLIQLPHQGRLPRRCRSGSSPAPGGRWCNSFARCNRFVAVVRTAPAVANALPGAPALQALVDESTVVVRMKAEDGLRRGAVDAL